MSVQKATTPSEWIRSPLTPLISGAGSTKPRGLARPEGGSESKEEALTPVRLVRTSAPLGERIPMDEREDYASWDRLEVPTAVRGLRVKRGVSQKLGRRRGGARGLPPEINLTPVLSHRYRFNCTTTVSATVQAIQMCGALGGICTVANSIVSSWTSSFRIKRITIWPAPAASVSAAAGAYVDWFFSDTSLFPDMSKSVTLPAGVTSTEALVFTPPAKSTAGFWVNSTATSSFTLFNLSVTAGDVIDIDVDQTLGVVNSTSSSLYQLTVTTGTLGNVYYLSLDGPGGNKIPPVAGMPTTH